MFFNIEGNNTWGMEKKSEWSECSLSVNIAFLELTD